MRILTADVMPKLHPFLTMHIIESEDEYAIIDPGPLRSISYVLGFLRRNNIPMNRIKYVLLTHIHIDHAGGVGELIKRLPNAEVVMHVKGIKHMSDPSLLWEKTKEVLGDLAETYGEIVKIPKSRMVGISGEEILLLGSTEIRVLEAPGHASHHLVYFVENGRLLFSGDAAGIYIEPWKLMLPTTPKPFNVEKALLSLEKMLSLGPKIVYLPHYGKNMNARRHLESYMELVMRLENVIRENIDRDIGELIEIVCAEIPFLGKAIGRVRGHPVWEGSIERSIRGIREYILWKKK